jgi:hypothetical protein
MLTTESPCIYPFNKQCIIFLSSHLLQLNIIVDITSVFTEMRHVWAEN